MNANGRIALGFVLGLAIGTCSALLLAPATGLRTRKNLNRKAKKLVKQLEALVTKKKTTKGSKRAAAAHKKNGRSMISAA
jgi:gas vesicle protein